MTSSTITGDRRWASARRGGMTVLGKVAVPKPINLPSQRLENHGVDPNVEIVPKGTLSWGSRPSSAGSNAWGTSPLSPTTDCSSSSPRHLVGHPLSIGDTRPSTAGSERAPDSNGNPWGTNSRPSSASGVLASNLASSSSLRPRSAETRPGSSHLSRFAESAPEGSGAWAAKTSPERKGVAFSANKGFSLSSGDFPTLGSEKDKSNMNLDPLDHASNGRPGSSGGVRTMPDGREISHDDDVSRNSDVKGNSWRNDGPPFMEDGPRPSMERWHREPRMYPNPNMAPHYESWRGASPVNPPGGGWYRGPPGPPPYGGGPVPPGGFHMEPFPYYHPQVPAPGLASSPPIPPGAGHHGHRPKNGDISHMPHVPHMHPRISMRPGFYPGPVHYDGFYRPPLGFCNPSERDLPFMGMPAGPPIYTIHGSQNGPDLNNAYPRSREGQGPKQVEPGHPRDPQGHYKGFGHPNDSWSQNEEEKWSHSHEKGILSKPPLKENAWGDDYTNDEDIRYGKHETFEVASRSFDDKFVPINASSGKFSERLSIINETQTRSSIENVASTRDHSLIQKIEGLNAKARATGRKQEGFQEAPNDRVQMINPMDHQSAIEAIADVGLERHYPSGVHVPVSCCNDVSAVDKSQESAVASGTVPPRRSGCGAQYRGGSHTRVGFHGQESDESERKPGIHSVLETGSRSLTNHQVGEHNAAVQAAEQSKTNVMGKCDGEFVVSSIDPSDMQRARMREIAKQRAIQLQKEEDERVREQKAKALAKLEELNRRSANQVVENLHQSDPTPPPVDVPKKRDVSRNQPELSVDANRSFGSSSASSNNSPLIIERSTSNTVDFDVSSRPLAAETNRSAYQDDSLSFQKQLPIADNSVDNAFSHRTGPQVREVVKQKQGGHKQRQSVPPEKISVLNAILTGSTDAEKDLKVVSASQEFTGSFVDPRIGKEEAGTPVTAELPVQKRKIPKSGKNRHRVEEPSEAVSSSVIPPKDSNLAQAIPESAEQNSSSLPVYSISTQLSANPKDSIQSSGNHSSSSREDTHGRTSSAWKAQQYRKPRNSQGNRPSEKIHSNEAVWAPVQPHNKLEVADQTSQKADGPLVSSAGDILAHNGSKTRRAEMERYVPKPVAKELAQQGSVQQPSSPSIDPAATDICNGREKASHGHEHVKKARANVESKYVDGKNRHQRPQGSWRQRVSAELTSAQDSLDCSASTSNNIQTCNGSQSTVRSDESFLRGLPSRSEEFLETGPQTFISDGWDSVNDSSSNSLAGFNEVKDHIPSGRGKRHPFKGHKGSGSHEIIDHKNSNVGLTDLLCSHAEANQMDRNISSKDNRAAGDRSVPHWQPKFQGHVTRNQQGNMFRGSQNSIPEDKEALKNETGPSGGSRFSPLDKHSIANDPLSVSENKGASEMMPSTGNQEAKQNRRVASVKKRSDSSSQEPEALAGEVEPVSFGPTDGCNEQHPSGYRKNANHSGRSDRGHAVREDWSSTGQENKQRFSSANRERQRQNSHYEYQPVGPYNGGSRSNGSGVQRENQSVVSGVQDRGQNYSRRGRGNFRGRQSGIE